MLNAKKRMRKKCRSIKIIKNEKKKRRKHYQKDNEEKKKYRIYA